MSGKPSILSSLLDLIAPQCCVLCGDGERTLCEPCLNRWAGPARRCSQLTFPVYAVRGYDPEAARVISGVKDHQRRWLMQLLVQAVSKACVELLTQSSTTEGALLLVPIPSRPGAVRRRGEDVVLTVAERAANALRTQGWRADAHSLLEHSRRVADQTTLTAEQRKQNLDHAFQLSPAWIRKNGRRVVGHSRIIVIDDLITTGASMQEAHRALTSGLHGQFTILGGACAASTSL